MDTAWFAIDNDGNVALFNTGEAGAVPEEAYIGNDSPDCYDLQDELRTLPATGYKLDPDGERDANPWTPHVAFDDDVAPEATAYMFVSDLVPVADLLARLAAEEMAATTSRAVRFRLSDRAAFEELHARDACLGCYREWGGSRRLEIAAHGVYRYEHTCENWISGPYARTTVPMKPLTIDQIPEAVRAYAIAFDGRFAETARLQPVEHWKCMAWESAWLSADGKTARPFEPQDEADWDYIANERDHDGGIEYVNEPLTPGPAKPRWWK